MSFIDDTFVSVPPKYAGNKSSAIDGSINWMQHQMEQCWLQLSTAAVTLRYFFCESGSQETPNETVLNSPIKTGMWMLLVPDVTTLYQRDW